MAESKSKSELGPIIFYCKDCEEIVETNRLGRKYVYKCKKCGTKNVAFGTEKSIRSFFRLDEKKQEKTSKKGKKEIKKKEEVEEKGMEKGEEKQEEKS